MNIAIRGQTTDEPRTQTARTHYGVRLLRSTTPTYRLHNTKIVIIIFISVAHYLQRDNIGGGSE